MTGHRGRKVADTRTRKLRHQHLQENWMAAKDSAVSAYIDWINVQDSARSQQNPCPAPSNSPHEFNIDIIDIFTLSKTACIVRDDTSTITEALVRNGYIGSSPESPVLAISIRTLQHYHRLRLRKPSFSIEAFAKVISDSYGVCQSILLGLTLLTRCRSLITHAIGPHFLKHSNFIWQLSVPLNRGSWRRLVATQPTGGFVMLVLPALTKYVSI